MNLLGQVENTCDLWDMCDRTKNLDSGGLHETKHTRQQSRKSN